MDGPSLQLQGNLISSIRKALLEQRPILTHLNADTTWLLQLPYPYGAARPPGRSRLNIVLDPWFQGPQSDVAKLFSTQWHAIKSSIQTMAELEDRLREVEAIAQSLPSQSRNGKRERFHPYSRKSYVDAVVISHEFTDHCNKHTLLELDPEVPIFATKRAVDLVKSWKHFKIVRQLPAFSGRDTDWRNTSLQPLPHWLGIFHVMSESDALFYHSAVVLTFDLHFERINESSDRSMPAEAIIYSPHGIHADELSHLSCAVPPIKTLALLHGLHDIRISIKQLNLGAHNGLKAREICQAKYWVSTHDEVKKEAGLISPFLRRKVLTLQEALNEYLKANDEISKESEVARMRKMTFADLASGESLLLA